MKKSTKAYLGAMVSLSLFLSGVVLASLSSSAWGTGHAASFLAIVGWIFAIHFALVAVISVRAAARWVNEVEDAS